MIEHVVVDTNLLIYALDPTSRYYAKTNQFFKKSPHSLYLTSKNVSELFAVGSKLGMSHKFLMHHYSGFKQNFTIICASSASLKIFEVLLGKYQPHGNFVYDIEMASILLAVGLDTVATVNEKDFKKIDEIKLIEFL